MCFRERLKDLINGNREAVFDFELRDFSDWLIENRRSIPKLYRYVPANYFSIRGLETQTIYLAEIGKMNDIFEGLSGHIDAKTQSDFTGISDLVYIKSFAESFDNMLLWGIYADRFSGLCIEYDLSNMSSHPDYYVHLFPVVYQQQRYATNHSLHFAIKELSEIKKDSDSCDIEFLRDIISMFLVKSEHWMHEEEWRLIVPYVYMHLEWSEGGIIDDDEDARLYSISDQTIDFPYATAVYMGPLIQSMQKQHTVDICRKLGIRVYESKPSATEFGLSYSEITHNL